MLPDYKLNNTFRDGTSGIVDSSGILNSQNPGIYAPLAAPEFFAQVKHKLGGLN